VRTFKAVIGWACVALLVWFVATNWTETTVTVVNARLTAPLGLIVVLSALLGAVGAEGFKKLIAWARGRRR
jgi:uncharacterized integral membrane protein